MSTTQAIIAVLSLLLGGGFAQTLGQALKARPEREAVIILPWKELNAALRGQNDTLQTELTGLRSRTRELEERIDKLNNLVDTKNQQIDRLEEFKDDLERKLRRAGIE